MKIYIYETRSSSEKLFPICSNRPVFDLKCGAFSILERVKKLFPNDKIVLFVRKEIKDIVGEKNELIVNPKEVDDGLWLNSNVLWNTSLVEQIKNKNNILCYKNKNLGFYLTEKQSNEWILNGGPVEKEYNNLDSQINKILISEFCIINDFANLIV